MKVTNWDRFSHDQHYRIFIALLAVLGHAASDFSEGSDERYMKWHAITRDCKSALWVRESNIYELHLLDEGAY